MRSGVTIHVVDDEEAVRKSLGFLLLSSGYTVRVHESATAFLEVAAELAGDCLLTDLRMPDMNGVELLRRLRAEDAMMPAIVISGHGDVPMAVEAMKAGALDFIEKPYDADFLLRAIESAVARRETRPRTESNSGEIRERVSTLTNRERQVLDLVVEGLPNKSIARQLSISQRTVEVHRANVMSKMHARSLPELVRMVLAIDACTP